jgi:hypothetical protein
MEYEIRRRRTYLLANRDNSAYSYRPCAEERKRDGYHVGRTAYRILALMQITVQYNILSCQDLKLKTQQKVVVPAFVMRRAPIGLM